ncbi:hypothetical protein [Loktanella sp. Alg231-35]|nr:hypothetical protein [Loktanella sp. Alg231-35]
MFTALNTNLYCIVFAQNTDSVLDGVIRQEFQFHRDGQSVRYAACTAPEC